MGTQITNDQEMTDKSNYCVDRKTQCVIMAGVQKSTGLLILDESRDNNMRGEDLREK